MGHGARLEGAVLLLLYSARFEPFLECQVKLFAVFLGAIALLFSACAEAEPLPTEQALKERVLGDPKAPITLIEYSSLGCPHCASFHANTLPKIKKNYIDTGKVKLGSTFSRKVDEFLQSIFVSLHFVKVKVNIWDVEVKWSTCEM